MWWMGLQISVSKLIAELPTCLTIHNPPNVQWLQEYYNITIVHISDTGGNPIIKTDK